MEQDNYKVSSSRTVPQWEKDEEKLKKRRKRRRDKKFKPNFQLPGVHKIVLDSTTQEAIGCKVGDNVTTEKPWMNIEKEAIQENIELHAESSEFLPIKNEIAEFPGIEFLVGYVPDESKDYDEFFICVTEEAKEAVNKIIKKLTRIQEESLENATHKKIKHWKSLGSEKEIEEAALKEHRPLLEVEIESRYPIKPFQVHFCSIKTGDLRFGYMELRSSEDTAGNIFRRRNDIDVQVTPTLKSREAQTTCTYPKNSSTQYEYVIPIDEVTCSEQCTTFFDKYVGQDLENFCDVLTVNDRINLYSNDYEKLILDEKFTHQVTLSHNRDYLCFIDMNLCQGKMVSSLTWHPMWTGCPILSYVEIAPQLYISSRITTDEVFKAVHDTHPVLFWSFDDDLKPKLLLETPRPVYALSCCPYDENLIIGGCVNGQIILWDITNKLKRVEEEEILTLYQQSYRTYMFSLMDWMKNIFNLALIRPTAISDLKYSHSGCVNSINWMSPFHNVSKNGKIEELSEGMERSLQVLTSAEDGTIMIWDFLKKPTTVPGGFKALRKMRRLKKRPSELLVDESPFKNLHLNLKPVYKINLVDVFQNHRLLSISTFYANYFKASYEPATKEGKKGTKISDRLFHKPVLEPPNTPPPQSFIIGTMEGDVIRASWDGQAFDSGEIVNWEECEILSHSKCHDGPVMSIDYSAVTDTILTIGGRIFALWKLDYPSHPLLWRRSTSIYTDGSFYTFDKSCMKLIRMDGYVEEWALFYKSKGPMQIFLTSNGAVTQVCTQPRKTKVLIAGLCDYRGLLRLFSRDHLNSESVKANVRSMNNFLNNEVERKIGFLKWQKEWNERSASKIEVLNTEEEEETTEEPAESKKPEKKKTAVIGPGQRYLQTVQEQHKANEQARIKRIILEKKQLNTEELLHRRKPLRKLEEEHEIKKRKQKNRLKDSDQIFQKTVAMLFPEVVREKPSLPPNPYEVSYLKDEKEDTYVDFQKISLDAQAHVKENPFNRDFNWATVLKAGRERRKRLEGPFVQYKHQERYEERKSQKFKEMKQLGAAALESERKSSVGLSDILDLTSVRTEFN